MKNILVIVFMILTMVVLVGSYLYSQTYATAKRHLAFRHHNVCPVSFEADRLKHCVDQTDCQACENTICTNVTTASPYKYSRGGEILEVPSGKWCLPPKADEIQCNSQTGNPVLTRDPNLNQFLWRCQCKNSKIVRNAGVYGDCNEVVACGEGDLVCPAGADFCTPGEKWADNPTWDPDAGVCTCPIGKKYVQHQGFKLCEIDSCFPGKTNQDGMCSCPPPINDKHNNWSSTVPSPTGKCISDPCNPSGYSSGGRCVCNSGSLPVQDELSPTGWVCKSPCGPKTNPCGSRGKCTFDSSGKVRCTNCRYPNYQSSDGLCNNIVKHGNVECQHSYECETRACDKTLAPIWKIGDGKKYCAAE